MPPSFAFSSRFAGASTRAYAGSPCDATSCWYSSLGVVPLTASISEASRSRIRPSLSVVHAEPSRRRKEAPADSSPPKPNEPSISPGTNHLNPTGTSTISLSSDSATLSIIEDDTSVLPIRADAGQSGRFPLKR